MPRWIARRSRELDAGRTPCSSFAEVRGFGGGAGDSGGGGAAGAGGTGGGTGTAAFTLEDPPKHIVIHPFYLRSTPPRSVVRHDT